MKARVELSFFSVSEIDLEDYGHDEETRFEDLTEDQQNEITDSLRDETIISCNIETIIPWS